MEHVCVTCVVFPLSWLSLLTPFFHVLATGRFTGCPELAPTRDKVVKDLVLTCDPPANLYLLLMCPARFHRTTHRLVYCLPSASPTFLSLCIGLSIACLCHLSHIPCARINIYHARTTFSQLFTSLSLSHFSSSMQIEIVICV